ncbi:MAG: sensor histidine kinase [Planctomycetota bacterium]
MAENSRLVKRAYWLIKLRWAAIVFLVAGVLVCSNILAVTLKEFALYSIAVVLGLYNLTVLLILNHLTKGKSKAHCPAVKKIINVQISADLLILAVLLHFSGGIENPFAFYFIFHMIIASILLTVLESYLQATFAVLAFGLFVLLEYRQFIPHYCLEGFAPECLHQHGLYVLGTFFVFTTALYLAVYMASYIAVRLKRAEYGYREANILLRQKDRIKDEYVLRVTHDIKGHLAAIQSCLGVVVNHLTGPLNDRQDDLIGRAYTRTVKLTGFVKELLRLTQMRLSNKLKMDNFSLSNTIKSSVAAVQSKAEEKSITLTSDIQLSAGTIVGNQFAIEETITNILLNAVKYTPENGRVDLRVKEDGVFFLIEIKDSGIGIPEEELPNIFDEFFRASNALKLERDGTGLGLSIAKHIIERHSGRIDVESKLGEGTTFSLRLPGSGNAATRVDHNCEPTHCLIKEKSCEDHKGRIQNRQKHSKANQLA